LENEKGYTLSGRNELASGLCSSGLCGKISISNQKIAKKKENGTVRRKLERGTVEEYNLM
jgi:hypothetical protein